MNFTQMKNSNVIDFIYEKLSSLYPNYSNRKPKAKIYSKAYTSLIGVMLSAQSQDKRTAVACNQLFSLADTPEEMIKLSREEIIEAIRPAGLHNAKSKNILATSKMLLEKLILEIDYIPRKNMLKNRFAKEFFIAQMQN